MIDPELQASYRSLRHNTNRLLLQAGMRPDLAPEFAYDNSDEEMMALREYDIRTFLSSNVPYIKNMWIECEEQARLLELLINDMMAEN